MVLDSSAVLAYLLDENGAEVVAGALEQGAVINLVNWAEVLSYFAERDHDLDSLEAELIRVGLLNQTLLILPPTDEDAKLAAKLRPMTRAAGLSLGDRLCLACGSRLGVAVLTCDRAWASPTLNLPVEVQLARP